MKKTILAVTAAIVATGISQADLSPYAGDANTLHLWHLDATGNPLADSAGSLDLFNWGQKGTFAVGSVAGLGKAYESSKTEASNLQSNGDISWANGMMGADGAFTWEMVLRPDEALGGSSSQVLLRHNGGGVNLRLLYTEAGYAWLRLEGSGGTLIRQQRLDALGANKYSTDAWFHLAVAYDGTGTGRFYWTKLDESYAGTANQAGADFSMSDLSLSDSALSFGGNAYLGGSVFNGAIDEIRISDIARAPDAFLIPEPATLGLLGASIGALAFIRRFVSL